jgi:hypothetical protein
MTTNETKKELQVEKLTDKSHKNERNFVSDVVLAS